MSDHQFGPEDEEESGEDEGGPGDRGAPDERDKPRHVAVEILQGQRALSFGRP